MGPFLLPGGGKERRLAAPGLNLFEGKPIEGFPMLRVTSKYQITIPPQVRKSLGIVPGTEVGLIRQGDQYVLVANPFEELKKKWRGKYRGRQSTDEYINEFRGPS